MSSSGESTRADLNVTEVKIDNIQPNDYNPNRQNETVARAEKESIEHFGFIDPIAVRKDPERRGKFIIIDGEHRWRTARELGYESLPVIVLDVTEEKAKKLTVILNETRGDADQLLLAELLQSIAGMEDFALALPYTDRELKKIMAVSEPQEPEPQTGTGEAEPPVEREVVLTYSEPRHEDFQSWVGMLSKDYGSKAVSDVVYEAVRREALRVNQGAAPPVAAP